MPTIPDPCTPLETSPTFRFSGKQGPADEVVFADGRVASGTDLPRVARWTGLGLDIALEWYPFEWAKDRETRIEAVRQLARDLARDVEWTHLHVTKGRNDAPRAQRFTRRALEQQIDAIVMQRFNANAPSPIALARTGGIDDVQYEQSLVLTEMGIAFRAHDSPALRKQMARRFDDVRAAHRAVAWATLGHAYAGSFSWALAGLSQKWGVQAGFGDHDEKQLTPPWRAHVGRLWLDIPDGRAAAEKRAKSAFAKVAGARIAFDDHGFEMDMEPASLPTDRSKARLDANRGFSIFRKAVGAAVNTALHNTAKRRALGMPR